MAFDANQITNFIGTVSKFEPKLLQNRKSSDFMELNTARLSYIYTLADRRFRILSHPFLLYSSMLELWENAISAPNVFLTAMLSLVLLYWLSVIVGALDMKSLDIDVDVDADIDAGGDLGNKTLPLPDKNVTIPDKNVGAGDGGGIFLGLLRFFNFGRVPFMVVLSILFLSLWSLSMVVNHPGSWLNPGNAYWLACLYSLPLLVASLFITKALTQPLVPLFRKLDTEQRPIDFTGKMGRLTLPLPPNQIGQVRLMVEQSDVVLRVKTQGDQALQKGDKVLIIEELKDEKCYLVQKIDD